MFPESFAEKWIDQLTKPNDVVLDPFSGRGTTAFQALLMGRRAVASDINDVAYCLTKAKTSAPILSSLRRRITQLESNFDGRQWQHVTSKSDVFFKTAYENRTLQQLLYLRQELQWRRSRVDTMLAALVLGSLHGESDKSSAYLSNQMPRTISTKPKYSVRFWRDRQLHPPSRDVFELLRSRACFRYESEPPKGRAFVFHTDMRLLPRLRRKLPRQISCAITSPPYFDVTNFEEDQWLRLWFLGGPPYPTTRRLAADDRHGTPDKYWSFIADMWRTLGALISKHGNVVIRLGTHRMSPDRLEKALTATAVFSGRKVERVSWTVSEIKNRQTGSFRPGSKGISVEIDCHYAFRS